MTRPDSTEFTSIPLAGGSTSPWTCLAEVDARSLPERPLQSLLTAADMMCQPNQPDNVPLILEGLADAYRSLPGTEAFQLAGAVGALFHELRHVYDFMSTGTGATFALAWRRAICRANLLVEDLRQWTMVDPARFVPVPLTQQWLADNLADRHSSELFRDVVGQMDRLTTMWTVERNAERIVPGLSISQLFESLAFTIQVEFTAGFFGPEAATALQAIAERPDAHISHQRYTYAATAAVQLLDTVDSMPDIARAWAVPILVTNALDEEVPPEPAADGTSRPPSVDRFFSAQGPIPLLLDVANLLRRFDYDELPVNEKLGPSMEYHIGSLFDEHLAALGDRDNRRRARIEKMQAFARETDEIVGSGRFSGDRSNHANTGLSIPAMYEVYHGIRMSDVGVHDGQRWTAMSLLGLLPPVAFRIRLPGDQTVLGRTASEWEWPPDQTLQADQELTRWRALTRPRRILDSDELRQMRSRLEAGDLDLGPRIRHQP